MNRDLEFNDEGERLNYDEFCKLFQYKENPSFEILPEELDMGAKFQNLVEGMRQISLNIGQESGFLLKDNGDLPERKNLTIGSGDNYGQGVVLDINQRHVFGAIHSHPDNTHFSAGNDGDLGQFIVSSADRDILAFSYMKISRSWPERLLAQSYRDHFRVMGLVHRDKVILLLKTDETPLIRVHSSQDLYDGYQKYGIDLLQRKTGYLELGYKFINGQSRPFKKGHEISVEQMFQYEDEYVRALAEKFRWRYYIGALTQEDSLMRRIV